MAPTPTPVTTSQSTVNDGKNKWGRIVSWAVLYCLQAILLWLSGYLFFILLVDLSENLLPEIRGLVPLILLVFSFIIALLLVVGFGRGLKGVSNAPESLRKGWNATVLLAVGIGVVCIMGYRYQHSRGQIKAVQGTGRQLSAAFDQYMLENGVSTAALSDLVGPDKYVKVIYPVAGETYPAYFTQNIPTITITGVAGARTVTYAP